MIISISELVAELVVKPKPVLCLDTCDFLDVLRGISRQSLAHFDSFTRIRDALDVNKDRLKPVITYLVKHEWEQDFEAVRSESLRELNTIANQLKLIVTTHFDVSIGPTASPNIHVEAVIDGFVELAIQVMNQASVLEQDRVCVDRALERLMAKRRPSHQKEIKDSIHLEHYLELARRLQASNFADRCLFVSANSSDFWAAKGGPHIHADLETEFRDAGLLFFGKLNAAVGQLGIR